MSNLEAQPEFEQLQPGQLCTSVEVHDPRPVPLGGLRAMTVYRTLPLKQRSLIGAWCFIDHYGPDDVAETGGMKVARHPHTGLATVSWLFEGAVNHLDSGGVAARVKPGELNLMLAGRGITHQELSTDDTRTLHGVQLWYALPDAERHGDNGFEHYAPEPLKLDGGEALVFIGELGGSKSPVNPRTTELFGAEVRIRPNATVKLDIQRDFEYGVLAEDADVAVNGVNVPHRSLGYTPPGADTLSVSAGDDGARVVVLGGVPFGEQIVMWWNFIGRDHDEIVEYRRRYMAELGFDEPDPQDAGKPKLFGEFPPGQPDALPAPVMPGVRLRPRG